MLRHVPQPLRGPLLMLLSTVLFTAMNLLLKQSMTDFRVWDISFYRFCGGLTLIVALSGWRRNPFGSADTRLLLLRGCTGSIAFIGFIASVRLLPVSTALMLLYSFPAFAAVSAAWLYGEKISATGWLSLAGVIAGVAILVDPTAGGELAGYAAGVLSAVFAGITVTIIRQLKQTNGAVVIYLYFCAVGSVVTAPFFLAAPVLPQTAGQLVMCGGIVVSSILGQLAMNQGFGHCRSWEGGLYMTSEVGLTALAGVLLFGDALGWRFGVGGAFIIGGAVAVQLERVLRPPAPGPQPPAEHRG